MSQASRRRFMKTGLGALLGLPALKTAFGTGKRPNILFCIADDASYPHMGAYGCPWVETPGFDRVARQGVLFTHAYTPNAKCSPSRACILTGRNSWQLEDAANHIPRFPETFVTYPEALAGKGYHTGFTGKGWAPGDPGTRDGRPRQPTGAPYHGKKADPPTSAIRRTDYAANFEDFLDEKPEDQPFCFWYGGHEPHRRYEYGSALLKGGKSYEALDRVFPFWPDNETVRTDMLDYAYEIEHFDNHLVKMLNALEARGELENTLVVVTADNGMPFPRIKGQTYELSNHLPLAVMWGNRLRNPGRVVEDYVSFIDFAPTFLEIAGASAEACGMQPITGRSLTDVVYSPKSGRVNPERDHVLIGKERHDVGRPQDQGYPVRGIVKDGYLYLYNFEPDRWPAGNPETGYLNTDGSPTKTECINARRDPRPDKYWRLSFGKRPAEELYNLQIDMDCVNNLADNPQYGKLKAGLQTQLFEELREQGDPRMLGRGHVFDEYEYADDNWRGFYESWEGGDGRTPGWINPSDFDGRLD